MTISVNGNDIAQAVEIASWVASMLAMLIMAGIVYLMVRPSRRERKRRHSDDEAVQLEEMLRLMERMEDRLEVLERAIPDGRDEEQGLLRSAEALKTGRTE